MNGNKSNIVIINATHLVFVRKSVMPNIKVVLLGTKDNLSKKDTKTSKIIDAITIILDNNKA